MSISHTLASAMVGLAIVAGVTVAVTKGGNDDETPITGQALERATAVALAHVGGGTVTDTEVGDEEGYYEVEVTIDGREVDVHLDASFTVIGVDEDDGEEGEDGEKDAD